MSTLDWIRLIQKEFRRRMTVIVPSAEPHKMRRRLAYYKRKQGLPWRFVVDQGCVWVKRYE